MCSQVRVRQSSSSAQLGLRQDADVLVHDAAGHAGELVLGRAAEVGHLDCRGGSRRASVLSASAVATSSAAELDKPPPTGTSLLYEHVEPVEPGAALPQKRSHAGDVARPIRAVPRPFQPSIGQVCSLGRSSATTWARPSFRARGGHPGALLQGHRQHEAVVVVRVLTDEIDATGWRGPARCRADRNAR